MQAIILAAGLSKRLRPLTDSTPKCLLKIGGKTILEMTMENILMNGVESFIIVTGYREYMIREFIERQYPELDVIFLTNYDYQNNNNSFSLWMTKDFVRGDCLLFDSDIIFDPMIVTRLLESDYENCLAVTRHELGEEEIKVIVEGDMRIRQIGKHLNPAESYGESIGIEKFSNIFFKKLCEVLDRKITLENNINEFYEASFQELYDTGNLMYAVDVSDLKCMEIDFPEDLRRAEEEFKFITEKLK